MENSISLRGKQKLLVMGKISLKEARARRDEARKLLANGRDPAEVKKAQKTAAQEEAANSFEVVTMEWFEKWRSNKSETTIQHKAALLEKSVFPEIGHLPVSSIDAPCVLRLLSEMEGLGLGNTVDKAKHAISQVLLRAVQWGFAKYDPVPALRGALKTTETRHMAAILDPLKIRELLRAIDGYDGALEVRTALKLLPLVFTRPGELRLMKWMELDLEKVE